MNKKPNLVTGVFVVLFVLTNSVIAAPLPKGDCKAPKPFTDLRHCHFEKTDLSNKDLKGVDLRVESLYQTDLSGADLTNALFDRNKLLLADLNGAKGLPKDILDTLKLYEILNEKNYLVTRNSNSTITLSPHDAVQGIDENIAGLANILMFSKVVNTPHTIAVLDWPRNNDYRNMVIITRFDNDKFNVPTCSQAMKLLNSDRYFYADWTSMQVRPLANGGGYLIGIKASGSDADGEGVGGWDMIAFLKLSADCHLSLLHREDAEWAQGVEGEWCRGGHLDFQILDGHTSELTLTNHTCLATSKKAKAVSKKIRLN